VNAATAFGAPELAEVRQFTAAGLGMQAFGILRGTVTFVVDVLLILTLTFFFVTDVEHIRAGFMRLVPRKARRRLTKSLTRPTQLLLVLSAGKLYWLLSSGSRRS
jgi:predicted PurR-regulated permease PerM